MGKRITIEQRRTNMIEGRMRLMGASNRKMQRAMNAQTDLVNEQALATTAPGIEAEVTKPTPESKGRSKVANPYPDALVLVAQLINVFTNLPSIYEKAEVDVSTFDQALSDLDHALELLNLTKREQMHILEEIKKNRKERRKAKEFLLVANPLYTFVHKYPSMLSDAQRIQKEMVRLADVNKRRTYTPRVRHDLQELFTAMRETAAATWEGGSE